MRRIQLVALSVAVLLVCVATSHAQTIIAELKVEGGGYTQIDDPFDPGEAIIVELGSVIDKLVLRFRSDGGTVNLGTVTINGTLGDPEGRLSVIVAGISQPDFPQFAAELLPPGAANVAGITVSNSALRGNTRVAIAATGNLTGSIEVGHVFKLQFNGTTSTTGEIQAAVTATAENNSVVTDTGLFDEETELPIYAEPMAYVRASKAIRGNLTATAGDIGIVSIGVTEAQTDGLQANVKALAGQIKSIYCAGAIGDPTASPAVLPEIWAREKITEIIGRWRGSESIISSPRTTR